LKRKPSQRYLQERATLTTQTFSGMGFHFKRKMRLPPRAKDRCKTGTEEHLVSSDKPLVAARKLLLRAINDVRDGRHAPYLASEPDTTFAGEIVVLSEVIAGDANPREYVENLTKRDLS